MYQISIITFAKPRVSIGMASSDSVVCLACGSPAVSGDRRVIGQSGQDSDITNLWKETATIELEN